MSEMLPGSPIGTVLPNVQVSVPDLDAELSELESEATSIYDNLTSDLVGDFSSINQDVTTISSNLIGDIANGLDDGELVRANVARKIINSAMNTLSDAYAKIVDLGFNIPTIDDVRYGNVSGDFMGSMTGLTPISDNAQLPQFPIPVVTPPNTTPVQPPIIDYTTSGGSANVDLGTCDPSKSNRVYSGKQAGLFNEACNEFVLSGWSDTFLAAKSGESESLGRWYQPWNSTATDIPIGEYWSFTISFKDHEHTQGKALTIMLPSGYTLLCNKKGELIGAVAEDSEFNYCPCVVYNETVKIISVDPACLAPNPPNPEVIPPTASGATCPVPSYSCGPEYGWNVPPLTPGERDFCKRMEFEQTNWDAMTARVESIVGMSFATAPSTTIGSAILSVITGSKTPILPDMINRFAKWLTKVIKDISIAPDCNNAQLAPLAAINAAVQFVEKWTGAVLPQVSMPIRHAANTTCQWSIPTPGEADAMFLSDTIDKARWECYQKADGNFITDFERLLDAKRTKADSLQVSQLFRRKQLTKAEYEKRLRSNGVLRPEDVTDIYNLTQSWPGISDVIRFLAKDVADEKIVKDFEMDADFDKKWTGDLIKYADAVGVDKDLGKLYWRAHWHIPSFTQLTEMMHRLRPGSVSEDLQVTQADVETALAQDDWLPFWGKRMIEISYRNVTRTDAIKAYEIHATDDEKLLEQFMDLGYNRKSAEFYTEYHRKKREINDRKTSGLPTIRALTRQYANCEITETEYRDAVSKLALSESHEAAMLESGRLAIKNAERKLSVNQVKRPFELGLIDYDEATNALSNTDIDPRCIRSLVDAWALKQLKRSKHLAAGQLCKMRERGIITHADHVRALVRNNWDKEEAALIAMECDVTVSERQVMRARREADRAQRIREKLARQEAKRLKLEACGPPSCPTNTPGGKLDPPNIVPDSTNL